MKYKITQSLRSYQKIIVDADSKKKAIKKADNALETEWEEIKGEDFIPFFETIEVIK
jgi:hypothetical protein